MLTLHFLFEVISYVILSLVSLLAALPLQPAALPKIGESHKPNQGTITIAHFGKNVLEYNLHLKPLMSKRKGMSLEEKREKMLEIFHESADVFVLKDIEKLGIKKGINGQTIKDVLQSLVDDDMVRQEKIGASNYFWSFPADASVKLEHSLSKAQEDLKATKKRRQEAQAAIDKEQVGKDESAQRAELMEQLRTLRQQVADASAVLEEYKDQDPDKIAAMNQGAEVATAAANRWLDNIHCLMSWCKKQFPGQESNLDAFFEENGYKDTMDYI